MKLHLDNNVVEGTPEELVKYQELLEEKEKEAEDSLRFGHEHQLTETEQRAKDTFKGLLGSLKVKDSYASSTDIQVGDRVKVLNSKHGAEGEATVTKVLEDGNVELAGTNKRGRYLTNWSNHVSSLEKIEAEEDKPMGYTFWYFERGTNNKFVVLEASPEGYFEDSKGRRYTYQAVSGLIKPIDNVYTREEFEEVKDKRGLLSYYPAVDLFSTSY